MKSKVTKGICITILGLMIAGVVGFYLYEVLWLKVPYTRNLFRAIAITILLLGTLLKITNGFGRKDLGVYEKAYEEELGSSFADQPFQRKKLLCACRLYDESNYRKALKYLHQLLPKARSVPDKIPVLLFMALCYTDIRVRSEAIRVYCELLKIDPYNAQVHSNLGGVYASEGDNEAAIMHYNESIELQPKNYYAYNNRASCYFRMGEYENAISDAKQALESKNNGSEAASLLAIIYALQGDEESKKHYYHIAISSGAAPKTLNATIGHFLNEQSIPSEADEG